MEKRTWCSLNLMRFVFSIIVLLFHLNVLMNGYIAVEFFFFVSGAFLYRKVTTQDDFNLSIYFKKRLIQFLPYTTITIFGTALVYITFNRLNFADTLRVLERALLESTLLDGFGIVGQSLEVSTGVAVEVLIDRHLWFIMCLLIMTPFAVQLFKLKEKLFLLIIPLMLYGFLKVKFGNIGEFASFEWTWAKSCMRTLAGLLLGGYSMYLSENLAYFSTETKRRVICYCSLIAAILLIILDTKAVNYSMFEYLIMILFFVYLAFLYSTNDIRIFDNSIISMIVNYLGSLSLGIYCYHPLAYTVVSVYGNVTNGMQIIIWVIVLTIVMTLVTRLGIKAVSAKRRLKYE